MPRQIEISSKNPHLISSSKKGLTIGQWMAHHFLPKKTLLEEEFQQTKSKIKKLGKEWKKIGKEGLEETDQGRIVLREFYRQATNYSETYWKLCNQKILAGNKSGRLMEERDQAKSDFDYFWKQHQKYKHPNGIKTHLEEQVDVLTTKLEKNRNEVYKVEKEFGKNSWQARNSLIQYVTTRAKFSQAESARLFSIKSKNPQLDEIISKRLIELEQEFKRMTNTLTHLKNTL
ncbi:MAG: hypothetical protein WC915_04815 [archaeon]|jgi:hypothetical protein